MAKKKAVAKPRTNLVAPADFDTLSPGDVVRFGAGKTEFTVEGHQKLPGGNRFLVVYGPLHGSPGVRGGGQAVFIGPRGTRRPDPVSGKMRRLAPKQVRLVRKASKPRPQPRKDEGE
jgi:hypothetical protein